MARPSVLSSERPASLVGARVLVVGLGRFGGGIGVTRWLAAEGARVTVTDSAPAQTLRESIEALTDVDVILHVGGHDHADLDGVDLAVINPAVDKRTSEFFQALERRGILWTTETNLFCARCPATVIGVTGSYGKSTTCAMLAEVLTAHHAGEPPEFGNAATGTATVRERVQVYLGGNIGRSLLTELPRIRAGDVVVYEMSNAQLEDLPRIGWAPPVAVITNLWPHHLGRYESAASYFDAKLNIVRDPRGASRVISGPCHPDAHEMLRKALENDGGRLLPVRNSAELLSLRIPGPHNLENAACVLEVCECLGVDHGLARRVVESFGGLPHRLQHVAAIDGVDYFNDSKATAPTATIAAVRSFNRPVVAILGGHEHDEPLAEMVQVLAGACRAVVCTGRSGPHFAAAMREAVSRTASGGPALNRKVHRADHTRPPGLVRAADPTSLDPSIPGSAPSRRRDVASPLPCFIEATLEAAVARARSLAVRGDVVLFAPGAPSFDHYNNYAERGEHFVRIIEEHIES